MIALRAGLVVTLLRWFLINFLRLNEVEALKIFPPCGTGIVARCDDVEDVMECLFRESIVFELLWDAQRYPASFRRQETQLVVICR